MFNLREAIIFFQSILRITGSLNCYLKDFYLPNGGTRGKKCIKLLHKATELKVSKRLFGRQKLVLKPSWF